MSLNSAPSGERVHIAFFGMRNVGKSSLINAVTGQNLSIVSNIKGTTTDPVKKTMELLPIGPVVVIDTPGIDDEGELGAMRVRKTYEILDMTDIAVVVSSGGVHHSPAETALIEKIKEKNIPYITAYNKSDVKRTTVEAKNEISVSALTGENINELKELISSMKTEITPKCRIISDLIDKDDVIVLVIPLDESAPKGRLILPQQQTIRDILDTYANAVCTRPEQLTKILDLLGDAVKIVVTDSQAFAQVNKIVPENIPLTSFSILMARYKGNLTKNAEAAAMLDNLSDGDTVLISEACTHHRQCNDIGTVKLPKLIEKYTGKKICFDWTSGNDFPEQLGKYKLIVHCGACMINEKQMKARIERCRKENVPITNYGIAIAKMTGILDRSISIFNN